MEITNNHPLTFIIIDDDDVTLFLTKRLIKQFNEAFNVVTFREAKEAIHHFINHEPKSSEVILLDINMPLYNGWDFLTEFEQNNLKGNVFMFSSSIDERDKDKSKTFQTVVGYISKPLDNQKLEDILNSL